jgi:magnesium transporter
MLTAYLFDRKHGKEIEDWADALGKLSKTHLLWVDLTDASDEEERAVQEGFDLADLTFRASEAATEPEFEQGDRYIRVTAIAVSDEETDAAREAVVVDCFIGQNWVLTAHAEEIAVVDDFRNLAEGGGELGALDAPSFLATLLEWVVTSYSRAFAEIEVMLEKFDLSVLRGSVARGGGRNAEEQISHLVEIRGRVGKLRRALTPHREIFATLGHPELDLISTGSSAERFEKLTAQVDNALATGRDAKDAVVSSFDLLILRTEHRTNEIVKILTLASILLLPGALLAGVMGMNINFSFHQFVHSPVFWFAVVAIVSIALATLGFARVRRWI